jgi:acyl-CoA synthetase (AMP-forming)/AMP-acid ligase II
MNLARLGEDSVRAFGEYVSLAFEGREWTNVEQQRAANRFAHALQRLGLRPGDRAVVLLPNCPEVLQAYGGILKAGGVAVPVVFLLGADEVHHILADSEATVVVTAPELLGKIEGWTGRSSWSAASPAGAPGTSSSPASRTRSRPSIAATTTSPSSSTRRARPAGPRAWRCPTPTLPPTPAPPPASTSWIARSGR